MNTAEQLRNRLWDAREAASFLKVSRSWIYARVERDEMPYIRVGALIRFVPSQLRDWAFTKDRIRGGHGERLQERRTLVVALQGRRRPLAWCACASQHQARRSSRIPRTRTARAPAARRPGAKRRQPPTHVRRADGPLAGALRVAAAVADHPAVGREAPAPCPRQAAPRWCCSSAPIATQLEDREAVAIDPESLRAYCHRLSAVASMRSVGWWMLPNPINQLELPKFKEARRKRATVAAEGRAARAGRLDAGVAAAFATAALLGLRRGELLALQKEDIDLREWTINVRRSATLTSPRVATTERCPFRNRCGRTSTPRPSLSPSKWVFPSADGTQRAPDTNLKAVLRRALGRAGIVEGYEHRCRKPGCGHVEPAPDDANRRCPKDNRALWIRPLPKKGVVFHSLRHATATLLARAKVHPTVAQKILRHANIETTLARDLRYQFATGSHLPKNEAPDPPHIVSKIRGPPMVGATGFEPATTCTPSKCATRLRYAPARTTNCGACVLTPAPGLVNVDRGYSALLFSAFLRTCEGRNVSTRRALISIS